MFDKIFEVIEFVLKLKKKKQEKNTKKEKKKKKDSLIGENVSIVQEDELVKKDEKVVESKKKELLLKAKILAVKILKWIVKILEKFLMWLISTIGVTGFFIIVIAIVLLIIIYGVINLDLSQTPPALVGDNSSTDCIQGSQVITSTTFTVDSLQTFNGNFTSNQLNQLRVLQIYSELFNGKKTDKMWEKEFPELCSEFGKTNLMKYMFGLYALKTDFSFMGVDDITKTPLSVDLLGINSSLKIDSSNYKGIKSQYSTTATLDNDGFFVPYDITLQLESFSRQEGSYAGYLVKAKEKVENYWDKINSDILSNYKVDDDVVLGDSVLKEHLILYLATSMYFSDYDFDNADDTFYINLFNLWCEIWMETSNFTISISEYSNIGTIRNSIKLDGSAKENISISNSNLHNTLWGYVKENSNNSEYFENHGLVLLNSLTDDNIDITYVGLLSLSVGDYVISELAKVAPLVTGGNAQDCDCYEQSGYSGNVNINVTEGQIQGPWSNTVREEVLLKQNQNIQSLYGAVFAIRNPNFDENALLGRGITLESWRLNTKWKIPYYYQTSLTLGGSDVPENGGISKVMNSYLTGLGGDNHLAYAGCHTFMYSYMASALTGTIITPVEMIPVLKYFEGITSGGLNQSQNVHKVFNDLGLKFAGARKDETLGNITEFCNYFGLTEPELKKYGDSKTQQKIVDTVLEKNGIVGSAMGEPFTSNKNHYVVISEKVGDKYRVVQYRNGHPIQRSVGDLFTWDELYTSMGNHTKERTYDFQRYYAWNPNLSLTGSVGGGGGTAVSVDLRPLDWFPYDDYAQYRIIDNNALQFAPEPGTEIIIPSGQDDINYTYTCARSFERWVADVKAGGKTGNKDSGIYQSMLKYAVGGVHFTDSGIGIVNGRYVIAVVSHIGTVGDYLDVYQEDGSVIPCIVGDVKSRGTNNYGNVQYKDLTLPNGEPLSYGHAFDGYEKWTSVVEMIMADSINGQEMTQEWVNKAVEEIGFNKNITKIVNLGSYFNDPNVNANANANVNCISGNSRTFNVGDFTEQKGVFQGPWGDLTEYIDKIEDSDLRERTKKLLPYVGQKPILEGKPIYNYTQDKWKNLNGYGIVRYAQYSPYINDVAGEEYRTLSGGSPSATLGASGCGIFACSSVISTLTGKYINPAELSIALNTWGYWNDLSAIKATTNEKADKLYHLSSNGVFKGWENEAILNYMGINTNRKLLSSSSSGELDSFIDDNGFVIIVVTPNGPLGHSFVHGSGHYVVIREKVENGKYLLYSSTNWDTTEGVTDAWRNANKVVTFSDLVAMESGGAAQTMWISK